MATGGRREYQAISPRGWKEDEKLHPDNHAQRKSDYEPDRQGGNSFQTYKDLLGTARGWENTIDLDFLEIQPINLIDRDMLFTGDEVWATIKEMPADRAPGPGGFIGLFFQKAWNIIKEDLMAAIHHPFLGYGRDFG